MRICYRCKELKEEELFYNTQNICKPCTKEKNREYYLKHKVRLNKYGREYYKDHTDYFSHYQKDYRAKHFQDKWFVYLIVKENYVGCTAYFDFRMNYGHKYNGKDLSEIKVLEVCDTKAEGYKVESYYHSIGYKGSTSLNFY